MNSHISKEFNEVLKLSKSKSEKCIEIFKEFKKVCEFVKIPAKCMIEIDKVLIDSDECIALYEKSMDHCNEHLKKCDEAECKRLFEKLMYSAKEGIKALSDVELECNHDLQPCIDAVNLSEEKCKDFILIVDELLKKIDCQPCC